MIMNRNEIDAIDKKLKTELNERRYIHTKGVAYTASALAATYGYNVDKALLAGYLHDCAKCLPDDTAFKLCLENNVKVSEIEYKNTALIHAKAGYVYARLEYGIDDTDILNAILYHTTGRPQMSDLEKIIYVADYIEPNRKKIEGLDEIRKISMIDIDKAVYMISENTLNYLKKSGSLIDDMTVKTYEYYKNIIEE